MDGENYSPRDPEILADSDREGADGVAGLPRRLERYAVAHQQARRMAKYILSLGENKLSRRLWYCGDRLILGDYIDRDSVRLLSAQFCKKHTLCQFCAIRRGAKLLEHYLPRLEQLLSESLDRCAQMVTFTLANGPDLDERLRHMFDAWTSLMQRRSDAVRGKGKSEWLWAEGGIASVEVTNRGNGWHVHIHCLVLSDKRISALALFGEGSEWHRITGDSYIGRVDILDESKPLAVNLMEILKYVTKFSDLTEAQTWQLHQAVSGKRMFRSWGVLRGIEAPEDLGEEHLSDSRYQLLLYQFIHGAGYHIRAMSPILPPTGTPDFEGQNPVFGRDFASLASLIEPEGKERQRLDPD